MRARESVGMHEAHCPACGELAQPEMVHTVPENSPLAEEKLKDLGIPDYDIVRVCRNDEECFLLLAGDSTDAETA